MTIAANQCPPAAMRDTTSSNPQVCIQCLAGYNQGHLHFEWVDLITLAEDAEDRGKDFREAFQECIDYVIETSPAMGADEWHYPDFQFLPYTFADEYMDIDKIEEFIDELIQFRSHYANELPDELFIWYLENRGGDFDTFTDDYYGEFEDDEDVAAEYISNEHSQDDEALRYEKCFDLQKFFDYELCYPNETINGSTYYFKD
tara:strand:+ start:160 stop:765 length:606 start_codon:yes stop_codon:yes gene_type:complete